MATNNVIDVKLINGSGKPSILVADIKVNALTTNFFRELNLVIDKIEMFQACADTDSRIVGAIFTSSKDKIFLAGADLFNLNDLMASGNLGEMMIGTIIQEGQDTFTRIEKLKIPTVAAMHGACLGGGLELALACDYRIVSKDKCTKLGLPEVTLGILPAWGGCTRLPNIIGMQKALRVILSGAPYAAAHAKKIGFVDKIVHRENLVKAAESIIRSKDSEPKSKPYSYIPACFIAKRAKQLTLKKTHGNYPAPLEIIDVIKREAKLSRYDSLANEKEAFLRLCKTIEMRNLLRIFFLQEKSKKLKINSQKYKPITHATVVGAGTMGAGICQWFSCKGINVILKDVKHELVAKGLSAVGDLYVKGVQAHKLTRPEARDGLARVSITTDDTPLTNQDLVIEAIVEDIDVKKQVLKRLEKKIGANTIIATNTSALSINEMAKVLDRPELFVGIHFFNPVHKMKLVEVVRGDKTSDETVSRAVKFVQSIGKLPVVVNDSPGFAVNRVLMPYLIKACEMLSNGHKIEDIDAAMVKFGMPMGPFRLMDEIGLDVCCDVATNISKSLQMDYPVNASLELTNRIGNDHLGKKTGRGFYRYKKGKCIRVKSTKEINPHILEKVMINEAWKVIDGDVMDDKDMLDFAMIMGTGWAPFRGGPIKHSESLHYLSQFKPGSVIKELWSAQ